MECFKCSEEAKCKLGPQLLGGVVMAKRITILSMPLRARSSTVVPSSSASMAASDLKQKFNAVSKPIPRENSSNYVPARPTDAFAIRSSALPSGIGHSAHSTLPYTIINGVIWVSSGDGQSVELYHGETGNLICFLVAHRGIVKSLHIANGTFGKSLPGEPNDNNEWVCSGGADKVVRLWSPVTLRCLTELVGHRSGIRCVHFSTKTSRLWTGDSSGSVLVWDSKTGQLLKRLSCGNRAVVCMEEDGLGDIWTGSADKCIRIWNGHNFSQQKKWIAHANYVTVLKRMGNGQVWSASEDIRVWDRSTGRCLSRLREHSHRITALHSATDKLALSGSLDGKVFMWNTQTASCLGELSSHPYAVNDVVSVQGMIWVLHVDHSIRIYNISAKKLLRILHWGTEGRVEIKSLDVPEIHVTAPNPTLRSTQGDKKVEVPEQVQEPEQAHDDQPSQIQATEKEDETPVPSLEEDDEFLEAEGQAATVETVTEELATISMDKKEEGEEKEEEEAKEEEAKAKAEELAQAKQGTSGEATLGAALPGQEVVEQVLVPAVVDENEGSNEEALPIIAWINRLHCVYGDRLEPVSHLFPIQNSATDLFNAIEDGLLLCLLLNIADDHLLDSRLLFPSTENAGRRNRARLTMRFEEKENLKLALNAARALGCDVTGISVDDFGRKQRNPDHILRFLWTLTDAVIYDPLHLNSVPWLAALLKEGESLADLKTQNGDVLLRRWMMSHIPGAGEIADYGCDLASGSVLVELMGVLSESHPPNAQLSTGTNDGQVAVSMGKKHGILFPLNQADFVQESSLMLATFCSYVFQKWPKSPPGARLQSEASVDGESFYVAWLNGLDLDDWVTSLSVDLKDGVILLQVLDRVEPGCVVWSRAKRNPRNAFQMIDNHNLVVETASKLKLQMQGVSGKNLYDGDMKYLLSLLWQLMRLECFASLRSILKGTGKNQEVTEASVIAWAQQKVEQASPWGGSIVPTPLKGFNDPSVSTGIFLLALVESTSRGAVPEHLIKVESCAENNLSNAKLAICSAWKLGIPILCRPTDIVQVNERMIVSFVATLMAFTETLRAEAAKRVQVFY